MREDHGPPGWTVEQTRRAQQASTRKTRVRLHVNTDRAAVAPSPAPISVVYFVQAVDGGPIKIGFSVDVDFRVGQLQTGSPVELRLIGCVQGDRELERSLHVELAEHHIRGEWFRPTVAVRDAMRRIGAVGVRDIARVRIPSSHGLHACSNCGYPGNGRAGGLCAPCREFARLRKSGKDPFAGLD